MKIPAYFRYSISFALILCLLAPVSVLAFGDGKKHFKKGMEAETAQKWDEAVEAFALAVADNPKNAEYRLHYTRALFNASQMYMKRGNTLAEQKDYASAYLAYRKAYAYDPVNELARAQMEKMVRLQEGLDSEKKTAEPSGTSSPQSVRLVPTGYQTTTAVPADFVMPQKLEKWKELIYPNGVDLQHIIRELAKELDLNVLFDEASFRQANRKINIELRGVTPAKALDYIFLQANLFFQKVGPRTILVADQNRRPNFQQLVLRTFYLANAKPADVAKIIQQAIPVQQGRTQPIPLIDEATNSLTIRDTAENISIIGRLIKSLDKDRAEVVMDVDIFEVSRQDLLKLGNQVGSESQLSSLGSFGAPLVRAGGSAGGVAANLPFKALDFASVAIGLPTSTLSAFQRKTNTRLLASTQVHAFNNEKSTAKIGQRVPVRSATYFNTGLNNGNSGNNGFGTTADVITYEQTGLTLEFEPLIFPNQDVQVKMSITSRDLAGAGVNDNPIFGEREIKGSARIQNNRTLLLASVAQNREERGKAGLPILGLIPILGRLFATPTKNDSNTDIVIAVTPRVLRAPVIMPEDEVERPTGSQATPTTNSLEAMVIQEEIEEQLANARRRGSNVGVQLPDQKITDAPQYVKSGVSQQQQQQTPPATTNDSQNTVASSNSEASSSNGSSNNNGEKPLVEAPTVPSILKPIDTSANRTLQITNTSEETDGKLETKKTSLPSTPETKTESGNGSAPQAELKLLSSLPEMKAGEKTKVAVMIKTAGSFRSAVLGLKFDPAKVAVRSVQFGDVFGAGVAQTSVTPFMNTGGKMFVSLSPQKDVTVASSGILAYVEIEALTPGVPALALETDILNVLTVDGRNFALKY